MLKDAIKNKKLAGGKAIEWNKKWEDETKRRFDDLTKRIAKNSTFVNLQELRFIGPKIDIEATGLSSVRLYKF